MTPRSRIAGERREDHVDDGRREPERRLVEQEHVRRRDERAPDRELLLLPARERAGLAVAELRQHRKELVGARRAGSRLRSSAAGREPEAQVLLDGQLAEDPAALGDERDARPRDRLGSPAAERAAVEADVSCRRGDEAHDRVQRRRLAGAVRADQADDLAALQLEAQSPRTAGTPP